MGNGARLKQDPPPRRKACVNCARTKQRCDHKPGSCTRCFDRGVECTYPAGKGAIRRTTSRSELSKSLLLAKHGTSSTSTPVQRDGSSSLYDLSNHVDIPSSPTVRDAALQHVGGSLPTADLNSTTGIGTGGADFDLRCTIDASSVQNRWLNAFIADPQLRPKVAPATTNTFVGRMLKAYTAGIISHGHLPPFIHPKQLQWKSESLPLHNCLSLLKICSGDARSQEVGDMAVQLIQGEMMKLYASRATLCSTMLLAAYQAYLIYVLTLYFHLERQYSPLFRQHMMDLQQLASESCSQGTVCSAELDHTRPQWSSWIRTEAKRRTLYVMYLFDNLLCTKDGTPIYVGTELKGLPAPASRLLWRATSEIEWQREYNLHLVDWGDGSLNIDELWRPDLSTSEDILARRQQRIDKWLESADEYCTMLYAVTSATHGE